MLLFVVKIAGMGKDFILHNHSVYSVFQSTGVPKYTLVDIQEQVDGIEEFEETPGSHLIIHGPSKTGKSTLWVSQIGYDKVIKIPCNMSTTLMGVYKDIIDELDIFFENSKSISEDVKASFGVELKAKVAAVFSAKGHASTDISDGKAVDSQRVVTPLIGARNIANYVKAAGKYILLENIHYASRDFRQELSKELHNFSDYNCKWVVVGVQHQADQIFIENRDLVGRMREIRSGALNRPKILEILNLGESLLNVKFGPEIVDGIVKESSGNAALVQDLAKHICICAGIKSTSSHRVDINDTAYFEEACRKIAKSFEQVYSTFCDDISKGGRSDGSTEKYRWFLKLIRETEIPSTGLLNTEVYRIVVDMGGGNIPQGSITQGLQYMNKLQAKRNIDPPVLEYDEVKCRLFLLDPYFKFVLRWIPSLLN